MMRPLNVSFHILSIYSAQRMSFGILISRTSRIVDSSALAPPTEGGRFVEQIEKLIIIPTETKLHENIIVGHGSLLNIPFRTSLNAVIRMTNFQNDALFATWSKK